MLTPSRRRRSHPDAFQRDLPPAPGVTVLDGGAEVSVYAGHADEVTLCLFEPGDVDGSTERRVPLTGRAHGWWFGFVPGMGVGQRYGFRVDGAWNSDAGLRHNPAKLLLDPYARALEGEVRWGPELFGHIVHADLTGDGEMISRRDSAARVPRSVVVDDRFDWGDDARPMRSRAETVLYEAHVKNLTQRHPDIPKRLRGTYAGLAHPASIAYLTSLGVTAVELLPMQAFVSEPAVARRGLTNHWGYNTIGFFAPHLGYAAAGDPQGAVDEVKGMVKLLHAAGIEVILDVVLNHTAEGDQTGPTMSFRGLDSRAYYRLDERGRDIDVTGCGNTLDLRHPVVTRMAMDSLRHWVSEYHIDGFRFDLAVALSRGRGDDYDPDHPFLVALRTDPMLSQVKLIAEPWDVGMHGWRTGQFPPPFSEWNDRFRDALRIFWVQDRRAQVDRTGTHGVHEIATRLAGSRDLFGRRDRGPVASVNFITAHDGFTLADLVAYDVKHNEANREGNGDGSDGNRSWNHGVEGVTNDPQILAARRQTMRNLLGTLLLSTGVPMLNAGDEFGRSQNGNNNPYCQDNKLTWFDWDLEPWQQDLRATVARLTQIRRELPVLRQRSWTVGREVDDDGSVDLAWFGGDGLAMDGRWTDPGTMTLQMLIAGSWLGERSALLVLHGGLGEVEVRLPDVPPVAAYQLLWDSVWERPREPGPAMAPMTVTLLGPSLRVYAADDAP
jgi:glycogen operon protein